MKKLLAAFSAVAALGLTVIQAAKTLIIAAAPMSHAGILNMVKPLLVKGGVGLEIKEFTDYVQPNVQVPERHPDVNFFQHQPYFDEFNKAKDTDPAAVIGMRIEPLGAYLGKYEKLDELSSGITVVTPNDATNGDRALFLLDKAGVIKLKDNKSTTATPKGIVDNPESIRIRELEAAVLPRVLTQVDMALINTNYALEAKLNPTKNALAIEGNGSSYVNILVARPSNEDSDTMQKLTKVLYSTEVEQLIQEKHKGAAVPAS